MISKEWWEARWKLLLGVAAVIVLIVVLPRSYAQIQEDVRFEIEMMRGDIESPEEALGLMGERERERYVQDTREQVQEMRNPEYAVDMARFEARDAYTATIFYVLMPLAVLLGAGLVSGEVGRGSIFLILSKPMSRTRVLLTKCAVCVACLLATAVIGGVGMILSFYARGYPAEAINLERFFVVGVLAWLASLFVFGVAVVASVVFRDVLRSLVAIGATMLTILAGPFVVRAFVEWLVWGNRMYQIDFRTLPEWYRAFDWFSLLTYWFAQRPYGGESIVTQSIVVCVATAAAVLMAAFWLFNRKTF